MNPRVWCVTGSRRNDNGARISKVTIIRIKNFFPIYREKVKTVTLCFIKIAIATRFDYNNAQSRSQTNLPW